MSSNTLEAVTDPSTVHTMIPAHTDMLKAEDSSPPHLDHPFQDEGVDRTGHDRLIAETRTGDRDEEGGRRAWLTVLGSILASFCGLGMSSAVGAFQTLYRNDILYGLPESQIAWISGSQSFATFALSPFTGALIDKYGHRVIFPIGVLALGSGFCLLSVASRYYQIITIHATLIPSGCSLLFMCPTALVGQWFVRRRGLAFGLLSTGASLGSVIWPLLLDNLTKTIGFGWAARVIGFTVLGLGALSYALISARIPPRPRKTLFVFNEFVKLEYGLVALNFALVGYGFYTFLIFIGEISAVVELDNGLCLMPGHARQAKGTGTYGQLAGLETFAPYLLIIHNGSSLAGRLLSGVLADRMGLYNTNTVGNILFVIVYFLWQICKDRTSLITLTVFMGLAGGSFVSLQPPLAMSTNSDPSLNGVLLGQQLFAMSLGQLASGPGFGGMIGQGSAPEKYAAFPLAISASGGIAILGALSMVIGRVHRARRLQTQKV